MTVLERRALLSATSLVFLGCATRQSPATPPAHDMRGRLMELEGSVGGRLGVAWYDRGSSTRFGYREHERFPMCSTFKLPLVAAVLGRVDRGEEALSRRIEYEAAALLEYAPVTREHLAEGGMTVEALCDAAVSMSDNTAANLLLDTIGGPAGLTQWFRSMNDATSRLDRNEPTLNTALPGDERDTTTPSAMAHVLYRVLVDPLTLTESSRRRLLGWLEMSPTGGKRLRAGLPHGYRAGDKTGTGENGAVNDVAIIWPPTEAPILLAAYSVGSTAGNERLSATLAQVARIVLSGVDQAAPGQDRPW